jgi:ribosomal protein S18 acetylase RimI-like enzyme
MGLYVLRFTHYVTMTQTQPQDRPLPAVRIRRARRGDIPALVSLFRAHLEYHAALDPRYEPASDARLTEFFHERLREPDTLILLAESGSAGASPSQGAQGYVLAQMRGSRRASSWVERLLLRVRPGQPFSFPAAVGYIADCFVAAEARRQGIGRQLVEQALEWCRRRGATEVELGVLPNNPTGRAFWEALGFKPCRMEMRREL